MNLKGVECKCGLSSFGAGEGQLAGSCEQSNEL
jgi:hypothetical protein